jgi:hypothetical protein
MKSNSILISVELPRFARFGVYFVCGECNRESFVIIDRAVDGIALSAWEPRGLPMLKPSPLSVCLVRTPEGKRLISCAYCPSGARALQVSQGRDGTCFSSEKYKGII